MSTPPGWNASVVLFNGEQGVPEFSGWTKVNQGVDGWAYFGALQPGADTSVSFSFFAKRCDLHRRVL
jgi:hypothetical protein